MFAKAAKELNLPMLKFCLPTWFWQRTAIIIFWFAISDVPAQNRKQRKAFDRLIQLTAQNGWAEYRAAPAFQDAVMNTYSFNNHSLLRFHEVVKDACGSQWDPLRRPLWHMAKTPEIIVMSLVSSADA